MWCYEKRRAFVFGVIVLVVELVGTQQGLLFGSLTTANAESLTSPYATSWRGDGREATLVKRLKREQTQEAAGGGTTADEGTKKFVATASSSSPSTGKASGSQKSNSSTTVATATTGKGIAKPVKEKTLFIPDRSPANLTNAQMKEESISDEEDDDSSSKRPGQGDFDEKAIQRAVIVVAGIAVIVVTYLGIKFVLIKRRKVAKRYGRVEASEMDLLDEVEDEESEEEEELFDINQQRRS